MEFFSKTTNFKFMETRRYWLTLSVIVFVAAIYIWVDKGVEKYGVEFVGGIQVDVRFEKPVTIAQVREAIDKNVPGASVQSYGGEHPDFSVRIKENDAGDIDKAIQTALQGLEGNSFTILKKDKVGPTIGAQVREKGLIAFIISLLMVTIYMTIRFDLFFALGAIIAVFHDSVIAAGVYVLAGYEVSGSLLAAVLTIVGYSVNDTIVIFDRIRENLAKASKTGSAGKRQAEAGMSFPELINLSVNQTLGRSLLTSFTVLLSAVSLWLLGTGAVSELAFAMVVGTIVGSYSTIFIASPFVLYCRAIAGKV